MAKEVKQNTDPAETAKLEAIKEIIFGNNIREYEKNLLKFVSLSISILQLSIKKFLSSKNMLMI